MTAGSAKLRRKLPKFRVHKHSQQAYVELSGHRFYLGHHESPEARERYQQRLAEWLANGRTLVAPPEELSVKELVARYWTHAERYYRSAEGKTSRELPNIRDAPRPLLALYGSTPVARFGGRALRVVREQMIENGLCRKSINCRVGRIKRTFKWAASEDLVPPEVYQSIQAVEGLRQGRSEAREGTPVRPVADTHVDAIAEHVGSQVWAIVQLLRLTGARAGEIVVMRPVDIDTSGHVWKYIPAQHKTSHRGHTRTVYLGPRAQSVLRPFLNRPVDAYCFSPAEAEAARRAEVHSRRTTPAGQGNEPGTNRRAEPRRRPGNRYTVDSLRQAIARACGRCGIAPWHPHQLRHAAATQLRKEFGLETARIILGHRSAAVTTIYAEADDQQAVETMRQIG